MKQQLPIPSSPDPFDKAIKHNFELITGRNVRLGKIDLLNTETLTGNDLTLANKLNELINRIQE